MYFCEKLITMKKFKLLTGLFLLALVASTIALAQTNKPTKKVKKMSVYSFKVEDSKGDLVDLSTYKGKTLLIVNVASKCGFTKQYTPLEAMYKKYEEKGLVILAFPCNQFLFQEPGTNEEIQSFCQLKYGVTFPVFGKLNVNGKDAHPLYKYLKDQTGGDSIKWNFNKFLLDKNGNIIKRYASGDSLEGLEADIQAIL